MMIMRLTIVAATVLAAIVAIGCAEGEKIYGVDELVEANDEAEIRSWAAYFVELNSVLREKIDKQHPELWDDPEAILQTAKNELGTGYTKNCLRPRHSQEEAFRSFLALKDTLGDQCDDNNSYKVLARNQLAHQALLEWVQFKGEYVDVISKVLHHYQLKHAQKCRPILRRKFEQEIAEVPADIRHKLEVAFDDLNLYDFGFRGMAPDIYKNLVAVYRPSFRRPISRGALRKLAKNLQSTQATPFVEPTRADKLLALFRREKRFGKTDLEHLRPLVDEHLFEPCKEYRKKLAKTMNEARIDAVFEDGDAQVEFIHGDELFYRALISNRLCGSLLESQANFYEPMVEAWNEALHH